MNFLDLINVDGRSFPAFASGNGWRWISFVFKQLLRSLWFNFLARGGARYGMFWTLTGHENASDFYAYMGARGPETCFYWCQVGKVLACKQLPLTRGRTCGPPFALICVRKSSLGCVVVRRYKSSLKSTSTEMARTP